MIKRLIIENFKSIRNIDLHLDPVTVLVGRSGTGKSNIVQALRFLRNSLIEHNQALQYEFGWDRVVPVGMKNAKLSIDVTFSIPGEELDYRYAICFEGAVHHGQLTVNSEQLTLGQEVLFSLKRTGQQIAWEKRPSVTTPVPATMGPAIGGFPSVQKIVFAYAALSTGLGYYHFPASTLDRFRPPQSYQNQHQLLRAIPGLTDDASNYLETIRNITQDFHRPNLRKSILATLKAVNGSVNSIELDSLSSPQRAVVAHNAGGQIFELNLEQESDGFRRFYAHLLALYQTPTKLVLVFEEPENAIFPGALSLLADEFIAAPAENRGQVILTTHSPLLLDSFDVENVRAVDMENGQTIVGKVSKTQRDSVRENLLKTGDLLTVERPMIEGKESEAQ